MHDEEIKRIILEVYFLFKKIIALTTSLAISLLSINGIYAQASVLNNINSEAVNASYLEKKDLNTNIYDFNNDIYAVNINNIDNSINIDFKSKSETIINDLNIHNKNIEEKKVDDALSTTNSDNIKIESIYGSTLIVGVITPKYWFGMQIGDGSLVTILNDGCTKEFMPIDEKLVANFTTSLCDNDAINNFRDVFGLNVPSALLSSTDGLINSFRDTNSFLRFNKMVITEIKKDKKSKKALKKHLFKRSEDGSLDDISIASVYVKNN